MTSPAEEFGELLSERLAGPVEAPVEPAATEAAATRLPQPNRAQGTSGGPVVAQSPSAAFAQFMATSLPTRVVDGGAWVDADTSSDVVVSGRWVPPKTAPGRKS